MKDEEKLIQILSLLKKGDYSQFNDFYELTKRNVYFSIFAVVKNEQTTEDLLQDSYVKLLNNIGSLKDDVSPLGYLLVIARNTALDYIKKATKETFIDEYDNENMYGGTEDKYEEENHIFEDMKKILKPKEYEIVILHIVEGLQFNEISERVHRPLGTVLWSYNNSIKKMRKEMKEHE